MGIFSVVLLLYAGLMALTKDYDMLPVRARVSVKPKDPKKYTVQLSKVIALTALSPALSALVGLWSDVSAVIVLIVSAVVFIWIGTGFMKNVQ